MDLFRVEKDHTRAEEVLMIIYILRKTSEYFSMKISC
jgi:hypothetical protein